VPSSLQSAQAKGLAALGTAGQASHGVGALPQWQEARDTWRRDFYG
jgi:hypothetical protein